MHKFIQYMTDKETFCIGQMAKSSKSGNKQSFFISFGSDENEIFIPITSEEFNNLIHDMIELQKIS